LPKFFVLAPGGDMALARFGHDEGVNALGKWSLRAFDD